MLIFSRFNYWCSWFSIVVLVLYFIYFYFILYCLPSLPTLSLVSLLIAYFLVFIFFKGGRLGFWVGNLIFFYIGFKAIHFPLSIVLPIFKSFALFCFYFSSSKCNFLRKFFSLIHWLFRMWCLTSTSSWIYKFPSVIDF